MNRIGIVPMSAKPYHAGHDALIRLASFECEQVIVFVSTGDRVRKGEYPIMANVMRKLWDDVILPSLPEKVFVVFVSNPVGATYELIGDRNEAPKLNDDETLVIYSDPVDMDRNFPECSLFKYGGNLTTKRLLARRHVPRDTTVNVSGTQMRAWLQHGDKLKFIANMPTSIDGEAVWAALSR